MSSDRAGRLQRRAAPAADRLVPLGALVVISVVLAFINYHFATIDNLRGVVQQQAVIIILVVGQTIVMIAGGIDLSVGSVVALVTVVSAKLMRDLSVEPAAAAAVGVAVGAACGYVNGLITTKARVPAFIATLGMMGMARGLALVVSRGVNISELPETFKAVGNLGHRGALTAVLFAAVTVLAVIAAHVVLGRTEFGRSVYAIGGSAEAARLSGIDVNRRLMWAFTLCGLLAGLAGTALLVRLGVGSPTNGDGYELLSISAAVIGGTSLFGGQGTIPESVVGALIIAVIRNGCNLNNVSSDWQYFVIGAMTVAAVFVDRLRRGRRA